MRLKAERKKPTPSLQIDQVGGPGGRVSGGRTVEIYKMVAGSGRLESGILVASSRASP